MTSTAVDRPRGHDRASWRGLLLLAGDWPVPKRRRRDVLVDVLLILFGLSGLLDLPTGGDALVHPASAAAVVVDVAGGAIVCASIWYRRRYPVLIALLAAAIVPFSLAASTPLLVVAFSTVLQLRPRLSFPLVGLMAATSMIEPVVHPRTGSFIGSAYATVVATLLMTTWALFVRARRQLVASLVDRADRAEADRQLSADRARLAERTRIAREMHDVLAHRISLIALHAGALEVAGALSDDQRRESGELIRSTARTALAELDEVVGVLGRGANDSATAHPVSTVPVTTLATVPALVEESRRAGTKVSLTFEIAEVDCAPEQLGRDVYRIVQEALTNVTKHAFGTAVTASVTGGPGDGVDVEVRNRLPLAPPGPPLLPGTGTGLVGLAERVTLAGGTFDHGSDGTFHVLAAHLPWEAP